MNWPFLTLTARPVLPAACSRSVCRARNAGICSRSTTCGDGFRLVRFVNVGRHRQAGTLLDRLQGAQAFLRARVRERLLPEVRLALSNDALKISGIASFSARSASLSAMSSVKSHDSITHGPAMKKRGSPARTGPCQWKPPCVLRDSVLRLYLDTVRLDDRCEVGQQFRRTLIAIFLATLPTSS